MRESLEDFARWCMVPVDHLERIEDEDAAMGHFFVVQRLLDALAADHKTAVHGSDAYAQFMRPIAACGTERSRERSA